jgi:hypothetical protein
MYKMNKQFYAARANANDKAMAQLSSKTKGNDCPNKSRTFKLVSYGQAGINLIEGPDGNTIATLLQGGDNRWQLLTADCQTLINFSGKPTLAQCIERL